jgi:RNA polymerase sigma-70 factor (ECF subfamily)
VTSDEIKLIKRAKRGDQVALGAVLRLYERRLYSTALQILGSSWDAQDAVQETLYEACANIGSLRDPSRLGAWLAKILTRKCYRLARQDASLLHFADVDYQACEFGTRHDDEVLQAVASLPQDQRVAIVLRFFMDLSYDDIQAVTGWQMGTVKSRINRARHQLREVLGERGVRRGL